MQLLIEMFKIRDLSYLMLIRPTLGPHLTALSDMTVQGQCERRGHVTGDLGDL